MGCLANGMGRWQMASGKWWMAVVVIYGVAGQAAGGKGRWLLAEEEKAMQAVEGEGERGRHGRGGETRKQHKVSCDVNFGAGLNTNLIELPVMDFVFPVLNGVVELLRKGVEEFILDQLDIETLLALEGFKPFSVDAGLVYHWGLFPVLLHLPGVQLRVEEEGCDEFCVSGWPQPRLGHEVKHGIFGVEHFLPTEIFVISDEP